MKKNFLVAAMLVSCLYHPQKLANDSLKNVSYGMLSMNINQSGYSNWAQGGKTSFQGYLRGEYNFHKQNNRWLTDVRTYAQVGGYIEKDKNWQAQNDVLNIEAVQGKHILKNLFFGVSLSYNSAILNTYREDIYGRKYKTAGFNSIGNMVAGAGVTYSKNHKFIVKFEPLSFHTRFISDPIYRYTGKEDTAYPRYFMSSEYHDVAGISAGEKSETSMVGRLNAYYMERMLNNKLNITQRLNVISDYKNSPENLNISYRGDVDYYLGKYINVGVTIQADYNDKVMSELQFMEMVRAGVSYRF
ncbi:MAG: DUF3078 domain-containing protein [Chryseobacterium taeanense]